MTAHPEAPVPARLFDDERERRWRARFTAVRMSRPRWAEDAPDRSVYTSNATGTTEIHAWDRAADEHRKVTDRRSGTHVATLPPDGEWIWWFADTDGDEFGHWVREPFAGPDRAPAEPALPGVEDGYPAGLELGRTVVAAGTSTDDGTRIWLRRGDGPAEVVYAHPEDAGVGALSEDEALLAISHSEHGDSRHPAVRVVRVEDGGAVAEKSDGPGKGLTPLVFSPVAGDQRLLLLHERHGREELLLWDVAADTETELAIELPGELAADFTPDGADLLVWHTHAARTRLFRYRLADGALTELPVAPGCVGSAEVRPDGTVEYTCSSAAEPSTIRALSPDGTDRVLLSPPGEAAPGSVPLRDLWVDGPGGRVHALVSVPEQPAGSPPPAVFSLHGGPHAADEDRFSAVRAAWVEAGFVVVEVNYRGSTGYGSTWRDAIEGRPGSTELEDVAAVLDRCVADGLVDPARCVVEGWSWGGYLALLAVGTQPQRWAVGIAGVPVADYLTAYADEMEQLRAFDRALFGGSPEQRPDAYRSASPLTYVDAVRAPVLVLAGENDPRCPIRQVDNYLDALAARGDLRYQVSRFDAGHGSLVVDETIAHIGTEIDFARRELGALAERSAAAQVTSA